MKILVTGANGQLGSELRNLVKNHPQDDFSFVTREEVPLDDLAKINQILDQYNPDLVINAGAYTAVDKAESEPELADMVNHLAVAKIADWVKIHDAKLIHISTDYVFQGNSSVALTESEKTNPINVYGLTKQKGEQAIVKSGADAVIIRTAWVYSIYGSNFVKTMIRLMTERNEISVISDQIGSPTYAHDLASAIMTIAHSEKWNSGIYHYSNEGQISWYDFAVAIREIANLDCEINPIPTEQYPTPAKRPKYSLLDKTKIKDTFAVEIPKWEESLRVMVGKL
ncbi:dTDP-4-dehydrorhamnose reductase [Sphingobacterium corticibacter]|uniref:dTDP-4-dehydrorhamnose reductase n=1 Tax=Sphingobacterium corticibacter TaxID=2171749 RepID=A0A2T8HJK3_9SPHI|nr:dTDP-4-dehydrorhamnose reductase [Sphingobacterium corticibacter]PVH25619.1 dTDP-4-dehydrorhamnose reductase [Sphingobacterium corticibacter]